MKITVNNVSKKIKQREVLKHINLEFESGKIYGLKGVNGSGKTMLMRLVCGLILPTKGEVLIDDKKLGKDISFPESVGLLLEYPSFVNSYTGLKNLKMIASLKGIISDEDIKQTLIKVGLDPNDTRKFKSYSLGMKQKLGIACAIMENPEILILDEPFNALDEKSVLMVEKIIKEYKNDKRIIIISCHEKEELEKLSDEIINISEGELINN